MTRVGVVGGGISGLAAARSLALAGLQVTLFETGPTWGGKLAATTIDGVRLDSGAESVLARRPEAVGLLTGLGLGHAVVHPTTAKPRLLVEQVLRALPPSLLGVPVDLDLLQPLLSASGYAEAVRLAAVDAPIVEDEPIGRVVDQRFGAEVTDRLLEPLLGGVYAGRARALSFDAVAHDLYLRARGGGSLLEHARAGLLPSRTPVFAGLSGGISSVVEVMLAELIHLGVDLRLGVTVRSVVADGGGYRIGLQRGDSVAAEAYDGVVLAAPARAAGRLVSGLIPDASAYAQIPYASVAVVTLVVRDLDSAASGVLVPPGELPSVKALTHSSLKWDWVGEQARTTWGAGAAVVRASIGRIGEESLLQLDDAALTARTWTEVRGLPGWADTTLVDATVTRWGGGLPQYRVGHRGLVAELRAQLDGVRGVAVAGAALDGVGVAACLGSAATAVSKIMSDLGGGRGEMADRTTDESEEART